MPQNLPPKNVKLGVWINMYTPSFRLFSSAKNKNIKSFATCWMRWKNMRPDKHFKSTAGSFSFTLCWHCDAMCISPPKTWGTLWRLDPDCTSDWTTSPTSRKWQKHAKAMLHQQVDSSLARRWNKFHHGSNQAIWNLSVGGPTYPPKSCTLDRN